MPEPIEVPQEIIYKHYRGVKVYQAKQIPVLTPDKSYIRFQINTNSLSQPPELPEQLQPAVRDPSLPEPKSSPIPWTAEADVSFWFKIGETNVNGQVLPIYSCDQLRYESLNLENGEISLMWPYLGDKNIHKFPAPVKKNPSSFDVYLYLLTVKDLRDSFWQGNPKFFQHVINQAEGLTYPSMKPQPKLTKIGEGRYELFVRLPQELMWDFGRLYTLLIHATETLPEKPWPEYPAPIYGQPIIMPDGVKYSIKTDKPQFFFWANLEPIFGGR